MKTGKLPFLVTWLNSPKLAVVFPLVALTITLVYIVAPYLFRPNDGMEVSFRGRTHVDTLYPGGAAERAGLLVGDKILEVEGVPTSTNYQKPIYQMGKNQAIPWFSK
jgi:predicted metalloprotease with PDZ domain